MVVVVITKARTRPQIQSQKLKKMKMTTTNQSYALLNGFKVSWFTLINLIIFEKFIFIFSLGQLKDKAEELHDIVKPELKAKKRDQFHDNCRKTCEAWFKNGECNDKGETKELVLNRCDSNCRARFYKRKILH